MSSRAYFVHLTKHLGEDGVQEVNTFRKEVFNYLYRNYTVVPTLARDKLWIVRQNALSFLVMPCP